MAKALPSGLNSLKPSSSQLSSNRPSIIPVRVKFVSLNGDDYPLIGNNMENMLVLEVFYLKT